MLSDTELAAMRGTQAEALPDMCQGRRKTAARDGMGGQNETWRTTAIVACRVAPSGYIPQERVIAERMAAASLWTLTLPAGTDVKAADRLAVGMRTFEAAAVLARSYETARRVVCTEVL